MYYIHIFLTILPFKQSFLIYKCYENKLNYSLRVAKRLHDGIRLKKLNLILKWFGGCSMLFWIKNLRNRTYQLHLNLVTRSFLIQHKLPNSFVNILPILYRVCTESSQQSSRISKVLSFHSLWKSCEFFIFWGDLWTRSYQFMQFFAFWDSFGFNQKKLLLQLVALWPVFLSYPSPLEWSQWS